MADAREVFEKHPDMKITLDDIAVFSARWQDKPSQLRNIAEALGIGLDSLVFVDDNPAEREAVRQLVPEVDVVALPRDPAGYVRALSEYLLFESSALTAEDTARTALYRARAQTAELQEGARSLDDFLGSLGMVATVSRMDEVTVARVAQLIVKTNQFNLTGRRRTPPEVAALSTDPTCTVMCVRLRDCFADHGLVGILIGFEHTDRSFSIDTWLMSCRVIGRTLEDEMLVIAAAEAASRGCSGLRGDYIPSAKNALVAGLYERLGFQREPPSPDTVHESTSWYLPLDKIPASPGFITITH
jgi:FkbH-like protein